MSAVHMPQINRSFIGGLSESVKNSTIGKGASNLISKICNLVATILRGLRDIVANHGGSKVYNFVSNHKQSSALVATGLVAGALYLAFAPQPKQKPKPDEHKGS